MDSHPYVEIVGRYFDGANAGDAELMRSCFCDDIAAYTIAIPARFGSEAASAFLVGLHETGARFTVDHAMVQEPEAVVEWSMIWTPPGASEPALSRGVDWFVFESGKIKEIREYCDPRWNPEPASLHQLEEFPYSSRGYPEFDDLDERLPHRVRRAKLTS